YLSVLCFPRALHHRDLHSFPTRRSSDLAGFSAVTAADKCFIWTVGIAANIARMVAIIIIVLFLTQNCAGCQKNGNEEEERFHIRSEEHTSELQSRFDLVCRLLLEKKKKC